MSPIQRFRLSNLLLCLPLLALGDTLVLKNGKEYTGHFISGSSVRVRFRPTGEAIRTFPAAEIDHIQFGPIAASAERRSTPAPAIRGEEQRQSASNPAPPPPPVQAPPTPAPVPTLAPGASGYPQTRTTPLDDTGSIDSAYTALRAATGILGPPQAAAQATQDGRAQVRFYANGAIYYTPQGGAHAIYGPIRAAWLAGGGEGSRLGYPISDEQDDNGGYNRMQTFEHGSIQWDQQNGAHIQYNGDVR